MTQHKQPIVKKRSNAGSRLSVGRLVIVSLGLLVCATFLWDRSTYISMGEVAGEELPNLHVRKSRQVITSRVGEHGLATASSRIQELLKGPDEFVAGRYVLTRDDTHYSSEVQQAMAASDNGRLHYVYGANGWDHWISVDVQITSSGDLAISMYQCCGLQKLFVGPRPIPSDVDDGTFFLE